MTTDLDTLLIALYVKIDDDLAGIRRVGRPPQLTDSELVCLAVAQALLGYASESHWLRAARRRLGHLFPYLPKQPGYNKRLRAALPLVKRVIRELAMDSDFWFDNHWIVDSTPVPCAMSRPSVQRSELAGWASYGYCASHSRYFWGLRLYLVCTPTGMPILWALANAKLGEREVLAAMLEVDADLVAERVGILLISDKGFSSGPFEREPAGQAAELKASSERRRRTGRCAMQALRLQDWKSDPMLVEIDVHDGDGGPYQLATKVMRPSARAPRSRSFTRMEHNPRAEKVRPQSCRPNLSTKTCRSVGRSARAPKLLSVSAPCAIESRTFDTVLHHDRD